MHGTTCWVGPALATAYVNLFIASAVDWPENRGATVAQQGMDWKVMIKMFGHSDFELILSTYFTQNDDARMVTEGDYLPRLSA